MFVNRLGGVISMVSASVVTAAMIYLPSYGLILVAVALVGPVGRLYRPASATPLSDLTLANRQVMIFAMYRFGLGLGATVATARSSHGAPSRRARPVRRPPPPEPGAGAAGEKEVGRGGYRAMLRDRRHVLYLLATLLYAMVYAQYLATLPLDVRARDVAVLWYT
ncbi:hypothetical protein OHA98_40755 [Streptomyces sp. NBC_00654]|uniref:hypothetical protein n=1 Tax=Streptomyces sp. NBC_00654 TaxID=2975799 RepID=UPI00225AF87C|nr:hypothetical protein [Streptomyces sp. NBC_00654]MCX4970954.1 hypothetical protein [Streptomyces sp. NBC_00654]